jgi:hypothetical protein
MRPEAGTDKTNGMVSFEKNTVKPENSRPDQ